MYRIDFNQTQNPYELNEMVRMFLPDSSYELVKLNINDSKEPKSLRIPDGIIDKNEGKRYLYRFFSKEAGYFPEWGILTGIRPVKLTGEILKKTGSKSLTKDVLIDDYYVSSKKADLLLSIFDVQQKYFNRTDTNTVSLYIGIPFCPSRCLYCSFTSCQANEEEIGLYLNALFTEMSFVGKEMERKKIYPESIYIGGGTPTTLNAKNLSELLYRINHFFNMKHVKEFTVEAGRPDTITLEKLEIILENGGDRICINPQTMKKDTLKRIGRNHGPEDLYRSVNLARRAGFQKINSDVIAGLPGENLDDFLFTIKALTDIHPENITVHTLAVKRASKLKEEDRYYSYGKGESADEMLKYGSLLLTDAGYRPYYLYRQKQTIGNLENTGYSLPGTEGLYNIKTMHECQTNIAMGAGSISKVVFPKENRLERVPNVSNYKIYIERIDEMLSRKKERIFL